MSRRLRELLDRLRDWWLGAYGRHAYDQAAEQPPVVRLRRAWPPEADYAAELRCRALTPRLFSDEETYWRNQWQDLFIWAAAMRAERNAYRRWWGLPPIEPPPPPVFPVALPAQRVAA